MDTSRSSADTPGEMRDEVERAIKRVEAAGVDPWFYGDVPDNAELLEDWAGSCERAASALSYLAYKLENAARAARDGAIGGRDG